MPDKTDSRITLIRRTIVGLAIAAILAIGGFGLWYATNNTDAATQEGYSLLDKPRPDKGEIIKVYEFFSYACNHCRNFEPLLNNWGKTIDDNVVIEKIPVGTEGVWGALARAYHAMEVLNILDTGHLKVFASIHDRHLNLSTTKALADFLAGGDISARRFYDMAESDEINRQLEANQALADDWQIRSVPSLVVAGKYLVSTEGGMRRALDVVDELIEKEQATR